MRSANIVRRIVLGSSMVFAALGAPTAPAGATPEVCGYVEGTLFNGQPYSTEGYLTRCEDPCSPGGVGWGTPYDAEVTTGELFVCLRGM